MDRKSFCSFYISEYHLLTILLPYIDKEISNSKNIEVILEDDMIEHVKKYLKRTEFFNVNKIIKLNWKKVKGDFLNLNENTDIIIVCGKEKFIKKVNMSIGKNIKEVINCFNIESLNSLDKIVKEHDFVLRTNGLCEVKKSSHNEQKRKTIQTQI